MWYQLFGKYILLHFNKTLELLSACQLEIQFYLQQQNIKFVKELLSFYLQ